MIILAGDIGGTKTNLARFEWDGHRLTRIDGRSFVSRDAPGLEPLLDAFSVGAGASADAACFGIAGPVVNGRCETTNLPWVVDTALLRGHLELENVWLLNDLEATAYGIAGLEPDELVTLQEGVPQAGNAVLIAAGTGLGECFLFWNGQTHVPSPSEGGHTDFAPRDPWEMDLLRYLTARYGHASYERILSGPGFVELFQYLRWQGRRPTPAIEAALAGTHHPTQVISEAGLLRLDPMCTEVIDRFVEIYGAEAGNLALKGLAVGGVYVGGGIAPKILSRLGEGGFMRGFLDKGRFRGLLERVPVRIILNQETALLGAARYGALCGIAR